MTPPSPSPSIAPKLPPMDHLRSLYAKLPIIFAKEIARRERRTSAPPLSARGTPAPMPSSTRASATPETSRVSASPITSSTPLPSLSAAGVKRERPPSRHSESPSAAKRRDTGDGKSNTGLMLPPSTPASASSPSLPQNFEVSRPRSTESSSGPSASIPPAMGAPSQPGPSSITRPSSSSSTHNAPAASPTSAHAAAALQRQRTPQMSSPNFPAGPLTSQGHDGMPGSGGAPSGAPSMQQQQQQQQQHPPTFPQNLGQMQMPPGLTEQQQQQLAYRMQLQQFQRQQLAQQQQHQQQQNAQQHALAQHGQFPQGQGSMQAQQAQMQQQQQLSQQQQQQMQQQMQMQMQSQAQATNRQMSPPSSAMSGFGGASAGPQQSQMPLGVPQVMQSSARGLPSGQAGAQMQSGVQSMAANPQLMRLYAMLQQNPPHPIVRMLHAQVPGFSQLPPEQQLLRMQV